LRGTKGSDVKLAQFAPPAFGRVAESGEAIDDELCLSPWIPDAGLEIAAG
jgi:hypothetical protein